MEVRNSYVWRLVFLRLGVRDSYVPGLVFVRLGVNFFTFRGYDSYLSVFFSYAWGLRILTFGDYRFLCFGASFFTFGG